MSAPDPPIRVDRAKGSHTELLDLALSRPEECRRRARSLLKRRVTLSAPSVVWQALGLAERESGQISIALRHLRRAARMAAREESQDRQADVLASLATTLTLAGRSKDALVELQGALELARGITAARVAMRGAMIFWDLGRYEDALDTLRQCLPVFRRHGDHVWAARALMTRALVHMEIGAARHADSDLSQALYFFTLTGQKAEAARATHNRGWLRYRVGDLPGALDFLGRASEQFAATSVDEPSVELDRCVVLLAAGLPSDALRHAQAALDRKRSRSILGYYRGDVELVAAKAALAVGEGSRATQHAAAARRVFKSQGRERDALLSDLTQAQARWAVGNGDPRFCDHVGKLADDLRRIRSPETTAASLLAGLAALHDGRIELGRSHLRLAAMQRFRGPALSRVTGWFAQILQADAALQPSVVFRSARAGLHILDQHQLSLGATEMRAAATAHGQDLARLALRHAKQRRSARELLIWSERLRATMLALPPIRPPDDRQLVVDLGKLRGVTHKLAEARRAGTSTAPLERERRRLEEAVRARTLQTPGRKETAERRFEVGRLLDSLGERRLVSIVEVDGELTVLVAADGRVRRFGAGRLEEAAKEVDYARFALRGAAGTGASRAEVGLRRLEAGGPRLQEVLFGDAVRALGDGPLIVVPPARLHATPWGVLPALRNRPFAVAPSAASWLRAGSRRAPERRDVVLVAGPNLGSRGAEVTTLRRTYDDARVLASGAATCEDTLSALNGAWLAHVAAHGVLRADNPLFSALTLDDGPLTVYDLERLKRAPYRLILSACESGIGTNAGADEVLGLASAVISLGTAGLLGSTVIVDDDAAVEVSLIVHEHLRAGADLAHALYRARRATAGDPVAHATSLAFLALGAA